MLPPDTEWKVTFFVRTQYMEYNVHAPSPEGAKFFAIQAASRDGLSPQSLTWIKTERLT